VGANRKAQGQKTRAGASLSEGNPPPVQYLSEAYRARDGKLEPIILDNVYSSSGVAEKNLAFSLWAHLLL